MNKVNRRGVSLMKYLIGLLIIIAVIYGGKIFSNQPVGPKSTETVMMPETDVKVFNVSGANFRFDPATITVKKGDKVKIIFKPLDMQHDFDITALGIDSPVTVAGETSEIEFTAATAGEFEYFCSVGQHRKNGMVGKLVVL